MAQAVLNIVVSKLANVIEKEIEHLGGVRAKVERVQRELIRIRCCLRDAASKRKGDERVQNWLNELRDVAYCIEDTIDTFFLGDDVDDNLKEDSTFLPPFKKLRLMSQVIYDHHKLGTELDEIQNLLKEISESRVHYGIKDLQDIVGEAVRMPFRRASYQEVDETEVVGMQADKNNILELLHREQTPRRAVITIVGAGGLGKTTLACMVYKSAQVDFDYHIMLSISQQFSLTELLRKMIRKYNDTVPNDRDVDYYAGELKSFLRNKRYLIILDDVWKDDLWIELKHILPNDKNMSRILMTSRFVEVAKSVDSNMSLYELNFLDDRESRDLLLKKALPDQQPSMEYPVDLFQLAGKLSKKCKGLPLALVVLGGVLLTNEPSYHAWERVLQTMNWHAEGRDCMQILAMSYEDMPYYLKACFQYLAIFPEDHVIKANRLIRMWIAEGFIPLEGRPTIEIMAEYCLEELAKRSMIQVLSRSANGLIKRFQVHDILRDLAMKEAGHENFFTVFSQASDKKPNRIIRRASLQAQEKNSLFMEYIGPNTRSLLLFNAENLECPKMSINCSNFRLLKVLEICGSKEKYKLNFLDQLIHLKYLGLKRCGIDLSSCSFKRMRTSLETLDVRGSWGKQPCADFWSIGTLRHVLVSNEITYRPLPKATHLSNLQTLKWVRVEQACDVKLPNLVKLGITDIKSDQWVSIINLLQTLPFLVSLGINGNDFPMKNLHAVPNYQNLQSLHLGGAWPENINIEASLLPPHLLKLSLAGSRLNYNPMPELGKLNTLKELRLEVVLSPYWMGSLICPLGFPVLQHLEVTDYKAMSLKVAEGVMPRLTYLKAHSEIGVHLPPELQHVLVQRCGNFFDLYSSELCDDYI